MARTYTKGRKNYKRKTPPHHGHCRICGYEPRLKGWKKTQQLRELKFDIIPFVERELKLKYLENQ